MIILGIDDATTTGYALLDAPHGVDPSVLASGAFKFSARESYYRQCIHLLRGLPAAPERVAVESPVPYYEDGKLRNMKGFQTHCGIFALWVDAIFEVFHLRAETVYPSEWQSKIFRGVCGEGTKAKSFSFCQIKWGREPSDDNEADALCIAFWMHTRYSFQLRVDGTTQRDRIKAAINTNIRRHGGDPLTLILLDEKEKK